MVTISTIATCDHYESKKMLVRAAVGMTVVVPLLVCFEPCMSLQSFAHLPVSSAVMHLRCGLSPRLGRVPCDLHRAIVAASVLFLSVKRPLLIAVEPLNCWKSHRRHRLAVQALRCDTSTNISEIRRMRVEPIDLPRVLNMVVAKASHCQI